MKTLGWLCASAIGIVIIACSGKNDSEGVAPPADLPSDDLTGADSGAVPGPSGGAGAEAGGGGGGVKPSLPPPSASDAGADAADAHAADAGKDASTKTPCIGVDALTTCIDRCGDDVACIEGCLHDCKVTP